MRNKIIKIKGIITLKEARQHIVLLEKMLEVYANCNEQLVVENLHYKGSGLEIVKKRAWWRAQHDKH